MQGTVFIFTELLHGTNNHLIFKSICLRLLCSGLNSFPAMLNNHLIGVNDTGTERTSFATMER